MLVVSFTDLSFTPLKINANTKSRIIWNSLDLCGMATMGDTLRFLGMPFAFSSSQEIIQTHFSAALARAASQQALAALASFAEG